MLHIPQGAFQLLFSTVAFFSHLTSFESVFTICCYALCPFFPLRHSRNFLSGIHAFAFSLVFKTMDPGLKIAGVTRRWESKFLLLLLSFYWER